MSVHLTGVGGSNGGSNRLTALRVMHSSYGAAVGPAGLRPGHAGLRERRWEQPPTAVGRGMDAGCLLGRGPLRVRASGGDEDRLQSVCRDDRQAKADGNGDAVGGPAIDFD
jgi:hypothetical protein